MTTRTLPKTGPLADEHSVLLWQTAAYADDLTDAVRSDRPLTPAYDAMLEFLHYRLLPYLADEERQLPATRLRDEHMTRLVRSDHERLRDDIDNIEGSRTRRLLTLATEVLVDRLDRHVQREETWVDDPAGGTAPDIDNWVLPLLFDGEIDVDALPTGHRDMIVRHRLQQMRYGDTLRLRARHDPHPLWRRQHACTPDTHVWVYEKDGPAEWLVRVTRRVQDGD